MQDVTLKLESVRDDQRDKYWNHLHGNVRMGDGEIKGAKRLMGWKPFVKRAVGVDHAGHLIKKPIVGKKCYLDAVGTGARGVFYHFILHHGDCYLIQEQPSRYRVRKYYAIALNGRLHEVSELDARKYILSTRIVREAMS